MSDQARVFSPGPEPARPFSDIVRNILQDVSHIVRAEILLARSELTEKLAGAKKGAGAIGTAAVAGLLSAACLVTACIAALTLVLPLWLAALIMGVFIGIIAAAAFAAGRARLSEIDPVPEQTFHTLEDNIAWAKRRARQ